MTGAALNRLLTVQADTSVLSGFLIFSTQYDASDVCLVTAYLSARQRSVVHLITLFRAKAAAESQNNFV